MLTLKERERAAYLAGDKKLAEVLQNHADLKTATRALIDLIGSLDLETVEGRLALFDWADRVEDLLNDGGAL